MVPSFLDPKHMKKSMLAAAHCGSFMQDFKMEIWKGMMGGNRISEKQLDESAMKLYDKWINPLWEKHYAKNKKKLSHDISGAPDGRVIRREGKGGRAISGHSISGR